jgi:hypothetical protein
MPLTKLFKIFKLQQWNRNSQFVTLGLRHISTEERNKVAEQFNPNHCSEKQQPYQHRRHWYTMAHARIK